jgi:uncharacterized protein YjbJ (UPF0337 family)
VREFIDKAKGRIKKAAGDLTGNQELKRQGERDERAGKIEGAVADVKRAVKDAGHAIEDKVRERTLRERNKTS